MKKLAIGVRSKWWYDETNPDKSIGFIKECGLEAIDYGINILFDDTFDEQNLTSFFDKSLDELYAYYKPLKDALKKYDVFISQMHGIFQLYYPGEDLKNDYLTEVTEKMIAVCKYMDCPAIVIHPWSGPNIHKAEEKQRNMEMYRRLIPSAKKYGVTVCLENLNQKYGVECYEGGCADAFEARDLIDTLNAEAGEEVFGFCLDTGHIRITRRNLYQFITTLGSRIKLLHIHDNDGVCDSHMLPYTQMERTGTKTSTDWEMFLKGLSEIGFEGTLSFECSKGIRTPPIELRKALLRFLVEIGKYFRKRIQE